MMRKGVLLVDDEEKALKYFSKAFSHRFPVFAASSASDALALLERHSEEIGVVVTDQRMPDVTGVELLTEVRRRFPRTVRILTTAYTELDLLIDAINSGAVYSFVTKPWQLADLQETLCTALEHYEKEVREHEQLERRLAEFREQIRDGRNYEVAVIAGKIGHYVHNALCPVSLILDEILETGYDAEGRLSMDFVANVNRHVHEVARTLKDLGQLTEPPVPDDFELVSLADILDRAIESTEMLRMEKGLKISVDFQGPAPFVRGVPAMLEKLFRFMIAEEVVSLPHGSRLQVSCQSRGSEGTKVVFEDFEPLRGNTSAEKMLQPFNLRGDNPREFGVFLASCYLIAHHHGGDLQIDVKENRSLLFSFFFPNQAGRIYDRRAQSDPRAR